MYATTALSAAPLGVELTLLEAGVPQASRARLSSLGLRSGTRFRLLLRTAGGGRVALVGGSRIALGRELLTQLRAEVVR